MLICGGFISFYTGLYTSINLSGIARLNTNGTLDSTFNLGTGANSTVNAMGLQSSGKIVVGGSFTSINNSNLNYLARLNTDGSVDASFNALIQDGNVQNLVVTPQDKIVICGNFTSINGYSRNYIARLNANGSLDTSFNPGLGANNPISGLALQTDGRVIIAGGVAGDFTAFNGVSLPANLARLNTNGTLDVTFNPGSGPNYFGFFVASQPDGKTLIAGHFTQFNGTNINRIARLNSDTSSTTLNSSEPQ